MRWAAAALGEGNNAAWVRAGWKSGAAQDMWGVGPHLAKPLQQVPNGSSQAPQFGDLLIFHEATGVKGPGHVAVVLNVNRSTGKLTFIGENQYAAPAVVQVPISPTNQVSATGFSKSLIVTGWLHGRSTTISSSLGYPVDPVCQKYGIPEPDTSITVAGTGYTPADKLFVHSAHYLLGEPTVGASGSWSLGFTVPTRPYEPKEPLTVSDSAGGLYATTFLSGAYTCWHTSGPGAVKWDAVGWDAFSPMVFYFDGVEMDHFGAANNGAMAARTFPYTCAPGSHTWEVTGTIFGSPAQASGTFTC